MAHLKPKLPFFLWNIVSARVRAYECTHAFTCMHLLAPPGASWLSGKSYLLDTVPGTSLLIVQLCRSGMATEPRHCTQKYPSSNHMRHRFWCGTETNITSKVNALLNTMHYKDGTCFAMKQQMSSLLTTSFCKPQKAKSVYLHASKNYRYACWKEHAVHLLICQAPSDVLSAFLAL